MNEETARELTGADHARLFGPPSPGQQTIEDLRELVTEIQGAEDTASLHVMASEAATLAGRLLADLDELAASLPRGEWGAGELETLANWLGEHGYDIGDQDDEGDNGGPRVILANGADTLSRAIAEVDADGDGLTGLSYQEMADLIIAAITGEKE